MDGDVATDDRFRQFRFLHRIAPAVDVDVVVVVVDVVIGGGVKFSAIAIVALVGSAPEQVPRQRAPSSCC